MGSEFIFLLCTSRVPLCRGGSGLEMCHGTRPTRTVMGKWQILRGSSHHGGLASLQMNPDDPQIGEATKLVHWLPGDVSVMPEASRGNSAERD